MASSLLLKRAFIAFGAGIIGHLGIGITELFGELEPIHPKARYSMKSAWFQMGGYFAINSNVPSPCGSWVPSAITDFIPGLLIWRWAESGLETSIDKAIFGILVGMNTATGAGYARRGIMFVPATLLWGSSAALVLSQVL
jgi:hypothetical protein